MLSIKEIFVTQTILVVVNGELEISYPFENANKNTLKRSGYKVRVNPPLDTFYASLFSGIDLF